MSISFGSINTGLPKDIVQQLVEAEKIPVKQMEARKSKIEDKKKLLSQLISHVEDIRGHLAKHGTSLSLKELKVNTNDSLISVVADKSKAITSDHQLEVLQLAQKSSAMSNGFESRSNSSVGVGYIEYSLPDGTVKELYIDSENSTLDAISALINKTPDLGVSANVINDGSDSDNPWRLVLALKDTGDNQTAEFPYFYFVDGDEDFYLEYEREAKDARVKLDGFEIEAPRNKLKELIPGLTIDLKKAAPGEEFSLSVGDDVNAVESKVSDLVDKINKVFTFINEQNRMDDKSDTSRTLGGDLTLQTLESRLRTAIIGNFQTEVGVRRLGDIGIAFNREGVLAFDSKKFEAAIANSYQVVSQVLTGYFPEEGGKYPGFMTALNDVVNLALLRPSGVLNSRKSGFESNIAQIDRQIANKLRNLEQKEKMLKDKFARLEGTISRIKSQGNGLASMGAPPQGAGVPQL